MKLVKSLITACAVLLLCCPRSRAAATKTPDTTNNPDGNFDKQLDYRLRWNLDTLVGDYERNGRRDPKWDEYAKAGLSYFAQVRSLAGSSKMKEPLANIPSAIKKAQTNGCDDPMVRYLYARYVTPSEKLASKERGEMFRQVAEDLCRSRYAPIRKFYASLRAAEALNPGATNTPAEVHHWRRQA